MPLTVATSHQPATEIDTRPADIQRMAREAGSSHATRAIGFTRPRIRTDLTSLRFPLEAHDMARFAEGELRLSLTQDIFLADNLSPCERRALLEHENGHVSDNVAIMGRIEAQLRADRPFAEILVDCDPFHRDDFPQVQRTIIARVGAVFVRMTNAAVAQRDTATEYARLDRAMRACRPGAAP